jgi:putative PEP-CTERM system TPR-repeat lipoprotein
MDHTHLKSILFGLLLALSLCSCGWFASEETRVERARTHMSAGDYRAAMSELKGVLDSNPQNSEARYLLARLSLQLGDLETAEKEADFAARAGVDAAKVRDLKYDLLLARRRYEELLNQLRTDTQTEGARRLLLEGQAHIGLQQPDEAQKAIAEALRIAPDNPDVLIEHARLLASDGRTDEALATLERVTSQTPPRAEAWTLRGTILARTGDHEKAREAYRKANELGQTSLPLPRRAAVLAALIESELALNDTAGATAALKQLAAMAPEAGITHYLRARIALVQKDPVLAASELQRVLQADPNNVQAQLLLAAAQVSRGSPEQAESALSRLLAAHPDNTAARSLLAQVYLSRHQPEAARKLLEAAPSQAQPDAFSDWLLGSALLQSGNKDGLSYLERSANARPQEPDLRVDLAAAYIAAGDSAKALQILQELPKETAAKPRSRALLAIASVTGKSTAEARREIEKLTTQYATDAAVQATAGAWLMANGDAAGARPLLERAIALDPSAPMPRVSLARLLLQGGDMDGAQKQLREVVKASPKFEAASVALSEIALRRGDRAGAKQILEQAIGVNPAAIESRLHLAQMAFADSDAARAQSLLDQAIAVSPDRASALNGAGKVLMSVGLYDDAITRFTAAVAAGLPEASLNAARAHVMLGRPDEARSLLLAALANKPGWREAELMVIELDARGGQVERALARARQLPRPPTTTLREVEGDVYSVAGRADAAVSAYQAAYDERPSASLAVKLYGLRQRLGTQRPESSLLSWLERNPTDTTVRTVLAQHYMQSSDPRGAIAQYERVLERDANNVVALNNLAWLLSGEPGGRAMGLARKAHELAPGAPGVADTYGWILVQAGDAQNGLKILERAATGAAGNGDITYHLAVAHARTGQRDQAIHLLDGLLSSDAQFASRAEAQRTLQELRSTR